MREPSSWRTFAAKCLFAPLAIGGLRRRVVFHVKHRYFPDLGLTVPIGGGLSCPILAEENMYSFREIFGDREYAGLAAHLALPQRWIDLGAHAGYFSLSLAAQHAAAGTGDAWQAALVEPDPRMLPVIQAGLDRNGIAGQVRLLAGLVGSGAGEKPFALRGGMLSSASAADAPTEREVAVPVVTELMLLAALPPPYDLVKVDIEGGEYDFVRHYGQICRAARALVMEWHVPSVADGRLAELRSALQVLGFARRVVLREARAGAGEGPLAVTGLDLFLRGQPE